MPDGIGRPGQPSPSQEGRPGPGLTPGQRGSSSSCCRGECRHDHDPNPPSHVPAAHSPWSLSDAASRCSQALWLGRHLRKGHIHRRRRRRRRRRALRQSTDDLHAPAQWTDRGIVCYTSPTTLRTTCLLYRRPPLPAVPCRRSCTIPQGRIDPAPLASCTANCYVYSRAHWG